MKILSYSHAYAGAGHNGGAETTLHDVMRLLRLDHTCDALVSEPHPDGSGPYVIDGVKVQNFASKLDPELYFPRYDLVIAHLAGALRGGIIARKLNKPIVHLIHNDQDYCIKAAERYADGLIFHTDWVAPQYSKADVPSVVFHPPVELARYTVETTREYITLVNLTAGQTHRLSYDKGAHTFYEMARRFPNEKFLGVKGGYGDQYIPDDLPPNVTIMEHTNNILDVYRKSKLILTPSKYESYGRVAVEAACSAIPSVITDTEGTHEAMGYAARYCDFGNYDDWEAGIREVLDDYDEYSWLAARRAHYNWQRTKYEYNQLRSFVIGVGVGTWLT